MMHLPSGVIEKSLRVIYGYSEIHGTKSSRNDLVKLLEVFPPWAVVDTLSKLGVLLTNLGVQAVTAQIWEVMLSQETKIKLEDKAKFRTHDKLLLISDRSLCILTEFARRHCRSASKEDIDQKYLFQIGQCILMANDLATESAFPEELTDGNLIDHQRQKAFIKKFATFTTREFLFNASEQFRYTLARSNLIYDLLQYRVKAEDYFDMSAKLEERLGFTLQDFFHATLAIWSYWANQNQNWERQYTCIDPTIIFPNGPPTPNFLRVLHYLSQDFAVNSPIPEARDEFHQWQYKFFDLRSKPLLRVEGKLYCASMKFLGDLFWNGPYFIGLNEFDDQSKVKLQRYIGGAAEVYVVDLLKDCVGKKVKVINTSKGNPVGECVVELRKNWLVLVEVKAGRADTRLQTEAADPAQSPKVQKMLYDGISQMSDRIAELRADGFTGRITPFLITGGHLPINSVAWENYLGSCGGLSIFGDPKVDFVQVMDLEAVETICALLKSKCRLGELLKAKLKPKWIREDMAMFFVKEWFPAFGGEPAHSVLISLNEVIFNGLAKGINLSSEQFDQDGSWRSVFGLETKRPSLGY